MSALNVNDIVRILNNPLSWRVVKVTGPFAVLESGQTGIRRRELLERLTLWQPKADEGRDA